MQRLETIEDYSRFFDSIREQGPRLIYQSETTRVGIDPLRDGFVLVMESRAKNAVGDDIWVQTSDTYPTDWNSVKKQSDGRRPGNRHLLFVLACDAGEIGDGASLQARASMVLLQPVVLAEGSRDGIPFRTVAQLDLFDEDGPTMVINEEVETHDFMGAMRWAPKSWSSQERIYLDDMSIEGWVTAWWAVERAEHLRNG
jgi:hypothetical protein